MRYSIKVNEVKGNEGNLKAFATVVFEDSFKITNIAILENTEKNSLFVSMPRYKSNERDVNNAIVFKDVCNPITKEFREELYGNILEAYEELGKKDNVCEKEAKFESSMPEFTVSVTPFEREGSNVKGLARIFFEDSFIVNNVTILEGKGKLFVAMPSYKTKKLDDNNKPVYKDICYPVTREFREKLYGEIIEKYEQEMTERKRKSRDDSVTNREDQFHRPSMDETPFR